MVSQRVGSKLRTYTRSSGSGLCILTIMLRLNSSLLGTGPTPWVWDWGSSRSLWFRLVHGSAFYHHCLEARHSQNKKACISFCAASRTYIAAQRTMVTSIILRILLNVRSTSLTYLGFIFIKDFLAMDII